MKLKTMVATVALAAVPFLVAAAAQHSDHHPAQATEQSAVVGNSMSQRMGHQMMQLITQVKDDLAALANENDLAVIHKRLSRDETLLEQFQGHMSGNMMNGHMTNCPGAQQQPQK